MPRFEYKLVPAPEKSIKQKGLKGPALFAATLEDMLNSLAIDGWEFQRSEILPEEVRAGLTSRTTVYRNLLVFRRALPDQPGPMTATASAPKPSRVTDGAPSLSNLFLKPDDTPGPGPAPKA